MALITKPTPTVTLSFKVNKRIGDAYTDVLDSARSAGLIVDVTDDLEKLLTRLARQINDAVAESTPTEESNAHD